MASACLPSIKRIVDVAENHFATLIKPVPSREHLSLCWDFLSCSPTSRTCKEGSKSERGVYSHCTDKNWEGTGGRGQACSFWRSRTAKTAAVASRKFLPSATILCWDQPTFLTKSFFLLESLLAGLKNCVQPFNLHLAELASGPVQWALCWVYPRPEEYGNIPPRWGRQGTGAGAMEETQEDKTKVLKLR